MKYIRQIILIALLSTVNTKRYSLRNKKKFKKQATPINVETKEFGDSEVVYSSDGPHQYYTLQTPKLYISKWDIDYDITDTKMKIWTKDRAHNKFRAEIKFTTELGPGVEKDVKIEELPGHRFSINLVLTMDGSFSQLKEYKVKTKEPEEPVVPPSVYSEDKKVLEQWAREDKAVKLHMEEVKKHEQEVRAEYSAMANSKIGRYSGQMGQMMKGAAGLTSVIMDRPDLA